VKRLIGLLLLAVVGCPSASAPEAEEAPTSVVSILGSDPPAGYERVTGVRPIHFPPDHGPHPRQQIEWWYTTANLDGEDGRRFGIEVTFFRFGLDALPRDEERESAWATRDLHMAHFAVTDVRGESFQAHERFSRGALGLAGAQGDPWRVWNESWSLEGTGGGERPFPLLLRADALDDAGRPCSLDLTLSSDRGPVLQGDRGFSRKGPEEGAASHYYSYPDLRISGSITLGAQSHSVTGTGWFDHEWSTSVLGETLDGWDWFALQFGDGSRLMVYELRRTDGGIAHYAAGTWIDPQGTVRPLRAEQLRTEVLDRWRSDASGIEYPSRWRLEVPSIDLTCEVIPVLADQELRLSTRYWEGAVDVRGTIGGAPAAGRGYVELVGYGEGGGE
jgi:predicted secreted hydrolase